MDIRINNVLKEINEKYGLDHAALKSRSREGHIVEARHHAFYLLRQRYGFTYGKIGKIFNRGHSNVYLTLKDYKPEVKEVKNSFLESLIMERSKLEGLLYATNTLIKYHEEQSKPTQ
ncbi:helix-turn-helix domain-containing protein [Flagellimonas sp. SN16]|uniref:helix-turn-helix domain-containing protein n=1 Tax=Flagellimonas sp. SN16 TaxID=3415142 RepID=UPI003C48DC69